MAGSAASSRELTVNDSNADNDAEIQLNDGTREMLLSVNPSSGGLIAMQTNDSLVFRTNGTTHMTLLNTGVVRSQAIRDNMLGGTTDFVRIDTTSGEMGVMGSSARFKEEIVDLGSASAVLSDLRPVAFRYREEAGGDGRTREYGLLAEEVAEVAPELVIYGEDGEPYSVRYHMLAPMLLSETQKQQRVIGLQQQEIQDQKQLIAALTGRLDEMERQLAAVSAGSDQ